MRADVFQGRADAASGAAEFTTRDVAESLQRLEGLARLLDSIVTIPGTSIRIGVDALIGLVPVIGDIVSQLIASYIILEARRLGASRWTIARMAANSTLDTVIGAIPIVGDVFDVAYRSNLRNVALLRKHIEKAHPAAAAAASAGLGRGRVIDGEATRVG